MSSKLDDFFSKKNKKTKKNRTILTLAVEDEVEEKSSPSPANDSVTTEPLAWLPENKGTNIISVMSVTSIMFNFFNYRSLKINL
jgi:hypothetical protein